MAARNLTLQAAIDDLHRIAVVQGQATSTARLDRLAKYCIEELEKRGLPGAQPDRPIPGGGREKQWDVAWEYDGKYRLAISLKSLLQNLAGTVPNRIDDLMGEVANAQLYSPELVIGYVMVFEVSKDVISKKHGLTWCDLLQDRLSRLSGRRSPAWTVGTIEAFVILRVDFSSGPKLLTNETDVRIMFDELVAQVRERNPGVQ